MREGPYEFREVPCTKSQRTVLAQVGSIVQGENILAVGEIRNPRDVPASSYFKICVLYNTVPNACRESFGRVTFSEAPSKHFLRKMIFV